MKIKTGRVAVMTMVLATLVGCGRSSAGGSEDSTAPASSAPWSAQAGLSPEDLQSRWWTWAMSEPEGTNPVADEDGSECERNQPKDVWFLAGTFGTRAERTCSIPDGVPVAFPLVNLTGEPATCTSFMSTAKGSAVLDGEKVEAESSQGESISVQGVVFNPVTGTDERFTTTGCGLWVQLPPLKPGKHTLTIRGQAQDFSVGVDYSLTVDAA
ncbi:signal protein [Streptomyces phaeochromogenes]